MLIRRLAALLFLLCVVHEARSESTPQMRLAEGLRPYLELLGNAEKPFSFQARVTVPIDGRSQNIEVRLQRSDKDSFDFEALHDEYAVEIRRRGDETAVILPKHGTAFLGQGPIAGEDHLSPVGFVDRIITPATSAAMVLPLLRQPDPQLLSLLLTQLLKVQAEPGSPTLKAGGNVRITFGEAPGELTVQTKDVEVRASLGPAQPTQDLASLIRNRGLNCSQLERSEIERQLSRGARRTLEILAPSMLLTNPAQEPRKVEHGELRWIDGHRVAILSGTPDQIGTAHGQLLRDEAQRCIDSVLYAFGTVQTVRTGRWFRLELDDAYARLSPHIPERHKVETQALAAALNVDPELAETLNVFPELFHCSGFAVFGKATKDGTLYHGRVLDYMTAIGLQDAATTFIVSAEGQIPFANVGYAGFIGSVTGMNARAISLGEMGGRGEGQWDGVPMATLMRRALEECSTLDEVMALWTNNPRTCEYYYVFADGKTNRTVGVAAVPEKVEFVQPGQGHPLLGDGIPDAVVLSAGSRLEKLRERVKEKHGQIDEETAVWLMSRPVAMQSNLHNALFVPAKGILYVANADHKRPAAERPYVRLDLNELLRSVDAPAAKAAMK